MKPLFKGMVINQLKIDYGKYTVLRYAKSGKSLLDIYQCSFYIRYFGAE